MDSASWDMAGWVLRKKTRPGGAATALFFASPWVRRWFVLNLDSRAIEEYADATRFELLSSFPLGELSAVKKLPFKPDRIYLLFYESFAALTTLSPVLELKISSAEERDVWFDAIQAMRRRAAEADNNLRHQAGQQHHHQHYQPRGWGDLPMFDNRRSSGGEEDGEEEVEGEEAAVKEEEDAPSQQQQPFEEASPFFTTGALASLAEAPLPIPDSAATSFATYDKKRSGDQLPVFVARTSALIAPARTSQNLIESQHMFMGKARTFALSINRDNAASALRKENAVSMQSVPTSTTPSPPPVEDRQHHRQVVVPFAPAAAASDLLHAAADASAFVKTAKQVQFLSQVIESEFPTAQDGGGVVRAIVDSMYLVTVPLAEHTVCVQGEFADRMYVIAAGEVGVYSQDFADKPRGELEHCKHEGGCFGVHNVLYHQPAPFTVRTHSDDTRLWVLTRGKYLELVTAEQKRLVSRKAKALEHVWLVHKYVGDEPALLDQLADAVEVETVRKGQVLVKRGAARVDKLYIVVSGSGSLAFGPDLVLQRHDVFGEMAALVEDEQDAAAAGGVEHDLVCRSDECEVMSLSRQHVEEVCGPLKLYIIKKFTHDLLLHVDDFDREFQRILQRDRPPAPSTLPATTSATSVSLVRLSTARNGDTANAPGDDVDDAAVDFDLPAFDPKSVQSLRPDLSLDRLQFLSQLGRGQFGVVHRAEALGGGGGQEQQQQVAVKVLRGHTITLNGWEQMVEQERDVMLELTHRAASTRFLLRLLHHFGDFKNCYLVLELCLGGSVYEEVVKKAKKSSSSDGTVTLARIRFYVASTVLALEAMHALTILHRDVKPENIMLTAASDGGQVKLADFGISKKALRTFSFCGTPDYMAPEMLTNRGYGAGVDFWATGIMLFELVSGYAPFSDFEASEIYEKTLAYADSHALEFPQRMREDHQLLTPECQQLILALLHPTKTKRLGVKYPGIQGVKTHAFFDGFDWAALANGEMSAPALPSDATATPPPPPPGATTTTAYDAQLHFSPDDITGWTRKF